MSSKPRSVLKKRPGTHDDRRVSFADPLASDKQPSRVQIPSVKACPPPKKAKPAEEAVDIITLVNQQSELTESVLNVEKKFEKQLNTLNGMTNDLMVFAEPVAAFSSESRLVNSKIAEHLRILEEVSMKKDEVVEKCKQFEKLNSSQPQNASLIVDLQKAVSLVNCYRFDASDVSDDVSGYYDRILSTLDQIIAQN